VRQKVLRAGCNGDREGVSKNEKTPSEEWVSSFLFTDFHRVSVDVSSGRGGNCTRVPSDANSSPENIRENWPLGLSELCRDDGALCELDASWHRLTPDVWAAIIQLMRGQS
jgi:hypothetical protein